MWACHVAAIFFFKVVINSATSPFIIFNYPLTTQCGPSHLVKLNTELKMPSTCINIIKPKDLARIIYNFQVPYQQLLQYIHAIPSKHNNQPDKPILNREQREALKNQIIHLDDTHYPSTVK